MASATALASSLPVFLSGALAVQLQADLDFGRSAQGALVASYFGAAAVASRVLGRVADRTTPGAAIRGSLGLTLCACLGIISLARSWTAICALLAVAGIGNAILNPALARVLSSSVPEHRQALGFGTKQAAVAAATLAAGLSIPLLVLDAGWRSAYVVAGVLCVLTMCSPRSLLSATRAVRVRDSATSTPLPRRSLTLLAAGFGLGAAAATGLAAFAVDSSVDSGLTPRDAGILLATASAGAVAVRMSAGWLVDRHRIDHLGLIALMLAGGVVGLLLMSVGTVTTAVPGLVLAYAVGWGWVGLMTFAVVDLHREAPGMATGIAQSGAAVGGATGPIFLGLVAEHGGYRFAWWAAAVLAAAAVACVLRARAMAGNT